MSQTNLPEVGRQNEAEPAPDADGCFVPGCVEPAEFLYVESVGDATLPEFPVCAGHGRELVPWFDQTIAEQDAWGANDA